MTDPDIVLGTAQLGADYGIANRSGLPSRTKALQMLRTAAKRGIGAFDTAPRYGHAEALIGEANVDVPVFTKIATSDVPASVHESLRRIRRPHIEVLYLHEPRWLTSDDAGVITQATGLLGGLVDSLGVSIYTPAEFELALAREEISYIQAPLSAADMRLAERGLLRDAARLGKQVHVRSVFLQGALLMPDEDLRVLLEPVGPFNRAIRRISERIGCSVIDILLAVPVAVEGVSGLVLGCETLEQLEGNLRSIREVDVPSDVIAEVLAMPRLPDVILDPRRWPQRASK